MNIGEQLYNEINSHYSDLDKITDKDIFIKTVDSFSPIPKEIDLQIVAESIYNELDKNFNFPDIIDILSKNVLIPIIVNIMKGLG